MGTGSSSWMVTVAVPWPGAMLASEGEESVTVNVSGPSCSGSGLSGTWITPACAPAAKVSVPLTAV